jgi:hypothetical protein
MCELSCNHLPIPVLSSPRGNENMATHDIEKAQETYAGFMSALKWSVPVIAVVVAFVVMLIS